MFAHLTQSQAISQSIAFSSLPDQCEIRIRSSLFFHFSKLFFFYKIAVSFTMVTKRSVENLQVAGGQLRNPPV